MGLHGREDGTLEHDERIDRPVTKEDLEKLKDQWACPWCKSELDCTDPLDGSAEDMISELWECTQRRCGFAFRRWFAEHSYQGIGDDNEIEVEV